MGNHHSYSGDILQFQQNTIAYLSFGRRELKIMSMMRQYHRRYRLGLGYREAFAAPRKVLVAPRSISSACFLGLKFIRRNPIKLLLIGGDIVLSIGNL